MKYLLTILTSILFVSSCSKDKGSSNSTTGGTTGTTNTVKDSSWITCDIYTHGVKSGTTSLYKHAHL